jgi:hypothetical protein
MLRARHAEEAFGALQDGETWREFMARVRRSGGVNARMRDLGL